MAEGKEIDVYKPPDLKERLKKEKKMLEQWFNGEKFPILKIKVNNDENNVVSCFERIVKLKNDRIYKLRVYVNSNYPDQLPDLVVCESPEPMPVNDPNWSARHATHTWQPLDGFLHICHWHWAVWTKENMIYQVFRKGKKWLKAYEKYLVTGKLPLELEQMELTEEERIIEQRGPLYHLLQIRQNAAFTISDRINELHHWFMSEILRNTLSEHLPMIVETINAHQRFIQSVVQRLQIDPFIQLLCEVGCSIFVDVAQTLDGLIRVTRLQCVMITSELTNYVTVFNVTLTLDGLIRVTFTPVSQPVHPRSLENS